MGRIHLTQDALDRLRAIYHQHGTLRDDDIIQDTLADPLSPLRPYYEWDHDRIVQRYMVARTREIISSAMTLLVVPLTTTVHGAPPMVVVPVHEWCRDPHAPAASQGYCNLVAVIQNNDWQRLSGAIVEAAIKARGNVVRTREAAYGLPAADFAARLGHVIALLDGIIADARAYAPAVQVPPPAAGTSAVVGPPGAAPP